MNNKQKAMLEKGANDDARSEFISLLRSTITANIKFLKWLKINKKDVFIFEDCFHVVKGNLKDLLSIYKDKK